MKNLLDESPDMKLNGRLAFSTQYVNKADIVGKTMLDIGCGFGWFERFALENGVQKIFGIEITPEDLRTVQSHIKDPRASFTEGSAIRIPLPDESVDTVVSWEVIEHIPKRTESMMFKEAHRVLKRGGTFYLSTPYAHILSNATDPAWWLIGHRHYSRAMLNRYAVENGFDVIDLRVRGGVWTVTESLNMYISKWIFRRPRIYKDLMDRKSTDEFGRTGGFVNIFGTFRKK